MQCKGPRRLRGQAPAPAAMTHPANASRSNPAKRRLSSDAPPSSTATKSARAPGQLAVEPRSLMATPVRAPAVPGGRAPMRNLELCEKHTCAGPQVVHLR